MCSTSCLLPLLVPLSPVPCPLSPPKEINPKGVCPMDSNVFDAVSLTSTCSHCPRSLVPCPRSPVPQKNNPKGVSNGFQCVRCRVSYLYLFPLSPVPGPLSPVPPKNLTLKVCIQWSPMCSMPCLLPLLVPTVPGPLSPIPPLRK